jgi:ATP-dependent DNA ligase
VTAAKFNPDAMRAQPDALPQWIKPQLTKLVNEPPAGSDWLHEIKFDGYRMHARLDRGAARLLTRTGLDWTHKYPAIASAVSAVPAKRAYFDGELCGVRPDGTTSFSMIQAASDTGNADALVFFVFDLLHIDRTAWFKRSPLRVSFRTLSGGRFVNGNLARAGPAAPCFFSRKSLLQPGVRLSA